MARARPSKRDPKEEALARDGVLNPRPEAVLDPLFVDNPFFDPGISSKSATRWCAVIRQTGSPFAMPPMSSGSHDRLFTKPRALWPTKASLDCFRSSAGPRAGTDLSRGDRFRQRVEGRKSRSLATAGYRRDRRSFWPRRPSAKPGAGAHAQKKRLRFSVAANAGRVVDAYERLRAAVVGAQQIPGAGLATLRRQGMAAWIKASDSIPDPTSPLPAARRPPTAGAIARNELTLILASLVVTLSAEPTHA